MSGGKPIPALGYDHLTRLYDPLMRWVLREAVFKRRLVKQAGIEPRHRVLDLGCGTGTLTILAATDCPGCEVIGIDADPRALVLAAAKASTVTPTVRFDLGDVTHLPYPDGSFDRALSSLLFHHLTPPAKRLALRELVRVLRPGGQLHLADWGRPTSPVMRLAFLTVRTLDGFAVTADHAAGRLPAMVTDAGFQNVAPATHFNTICGSLHLLRAEKPRDRVYGP